MNAACSSEGAILVKWRALTLTEKCQTPKFFFTKHHRNSYACTIYFVPFRTLCMSIHKAQKWGS